MRQANAMRYLLSLRVKQKLLPKWCQPRARPPNWCARSRPRRRSPNGGRGAEAVFRQGRMTASYVHFYFPSNPAAIAALFAPDPEVVFASRLAPTGEQVLCVSTASQGGAGLPAKRP